MKHTRIIVTHYGGPDALQVIAEERPEPKDGEVRVKVLAAGVSLPDLMMREGIHPETPSLPFTPGWDLIGVVDRLGPGVSGLESGLIVAALPISGAYAEFVCLPERELIPVPSGLDAAEAVSLVLNYVTAYQMLHRSAKVRRNQRVLIHGAAGGVGSALLQLGRLAGLEMYGTCSARDASVVSNLGGLPIDYRQLDFVNEILRLTGEGVDVVFDGIGGTHIWRSRTALRPGGTVVAYGLTSSLREGRLASGRSGRRRRFRAIAIFGLYIAGGWLLPGRKRVVPYSIQWLKRLRPALFRQDLLALFELLQQQKIKPLIAQRFPLAEARQAHELLGKGGVTGKIVLVRQVESRAPEPGPPLKTLESFTAQRATTSGLSPTRLARMHDCLLRHVGRGRLPGLVAVISRRGAEHVDAIGTLAFDRSAPMRRDTIFRLASVTKPITAVAAMILVEECKLRLDDPVDGVLPELANRAVLRTIDSELDDTVPAKRPITTRDLLTFRSGYGEVAFLSPTCPLQRALIEARLPLSVWMFPGTSDEFMQCLGRLPLAHQPGERWLYHMSAEILGVLISRVSGMPLSAFMRERIFEPLGMKDTGFTVPEAQLDRVATCYQTDFASGEITVLEEARRDLLARPCVFESGGGDQFVSTADDLLAFGRMMLNRGVYGNERILSRLSVELMTTDQLTPAQKAASPFFEDFWDSRGWGLGLSIVTRRDAVASVPGRFGWDGAFSTSLYVDPREDMVGVLMAQCRPAALRLPPVVLDFWTSAYQAIDD